MEKCEACRAFYHLFATSLINSIIQENGFYLSYDISWGQSNTVVFTYYLLNCYDSFALTPRYIDYFEIPFLA